MEPCCWLYVSGMRAARVPSDSASSVAELEWHMSEY